MKFKNILPAKKIVEKRGKGLRMLNMYKDVSQEREKKLLLITKETGGAIGLEQQ
ncbi:hypothetical protein [Paenibacillus sp. sgz500958]|uniref:hypothetical protein n=1 Tax=Paenibacillus sp. sgz500958 TaxID=3242475 RepID=UPI0036D402B9